MTLEELYIIVNELNEDEKPVIFFCNFLYVLAILIWLTLLCSTLFLPEGSGDILKDPKTLFGGSIYSFTIMAIGSQKKEDVKRKKKNTTQKLLKKVQSGGKKDLSSLEIRELLIEILNDEIKRK